MLPNISPARQPTIGYKAVILPYKSWCVLELEIPKHAIVYVDNVDTESKALRTDRVIPRRFLTVGKYPLPFCGEVAFSWWDPRFQYTKDVIAVTYLDKHGIYFFSTVAEAVNWGKGAMSGFRPRT